VSPSERTEQRGANGEQRWRCSERVAGTAAHVRVRIDVGGAPRGEYASIRADSHYAKSAVDFVIKSDVPQYGAFSKAESGSETCQLSEATAPQKPHVGKNFYEHKMNVYV
jgi:hypothetical protein